MKTIGNEAKEYQAHQTKNITELDSVSVDTVIEEKEYKDSDGNPFTIKVLTVEGDDYRVPIIVLKNLQEILKVQPGLKTFRVTKAGEGLKTRYTVIPLS